MNQETTIRNTYMIEIDNEVNGFRLGTLKYGREKLVLEGQKKTIQFVIGTKDQTKNDDGDYDKTLRVFNEYFKSNYRGL